ncbi:solute carrier family 26 member 6-like [Anneissia japonica]|uniref:solute carrier family 26 member 6-like n=1 Tax=Anneissia japonica TaxID=1529436 RepID=UPI0014256EF2|nr:solute carrier family 26 member 6-like [Anneissia japonica]
MAAYEELDNGILHGQREHIHITRPYYTEEEFKLNYEETKLQEQAFKEVVKRKVTNCSCSKESIKKATISFFPIITWLGSYDVRKSLLGDTISGFTVGVLRIPQGLAYAFLASLPPVYGLYINFFPVILYALMGTSRHISVGVFAVVSIMTGIAIDSVVEGRRTELSLIENGTVGFDEEEEKKKVAMLLCFLVGLIQFILGFFQLGFISVYLSEPVVRGFTTGAGMHVFTSQFKHLFGIKVSTYFGPFALIKSYKELFSELNTTNTATLIMAISSITALVAVKEIQDRYKDKIKFPIPMELIVIIVGTLVSGFVKLNTKYDVSIVGEIPTGLPAPQMVDFSYISSLLGSSFAISMVAFCGTLSMAKIFAKKHNYEIEANQELLAGGVTAIVSSFFSCFPPGCVLIWSVTFLAVVLLGVDLGLGAGVAFALITVVFRTQRPYCTKLGRIPHTDIYRDVYNYKGAKEIPGVVIFRCSSSLYYANTDYFRDSVYEISGVNPRKVQASREKALRKEENAKLKEKKKEEKLRKREKYSTVAKEEGVIEIQSLNNSSNEDNSLATSSLTSEESLKCQTIIIHCGTFNFIDLMGVNTLRDLIADYEKINIKVVLANCKAGIRMMLQRCGFFDTVGHDHLYVTIHDALIHSISGDLLDVISQDMYDRNNEPEQFNGGGQLTRVSSNVSQPSTDAHVKVSREGATVLENEDETNV